VDGRRDENAFGVLIVFLVITGSVWIIANLNSNMMPVSMQ
jgi:cytochrome o ubiquinol oxidase operon protein cyoD